MLNGLLINYNYCTGCHSCEAACKVEHGMETGEWGIRLMQNGPWHHEEDDTWEFDFVPVPTRRCDLCTDRVDEGRLPTCVHHCQGHCMEYGPVDELAKLMTSPHMVLFTPADR